MIALAPATLRELVQRHGGHAEGDATIEALAPPREARARCLAPLTSRKYLPDAERAKERGAELLIAAKLTRDPRVRALGGWVHEHAGFALAELLERAVVADEPARVAEDAIVAPGAVLHPRVSIGRRVRIGANAVIGAPGFGFAARGAELKHVPQKGGVVIEDDVWIGALVTIDAGTLGPTVVRRAAKIDAQVHVGHNCEIGEGAIIAAQSGLAGSVRIGRGARLGGQVGVADHVTVGDGAQIAAKSGVIGDVPAGAVVAGYPALPRMRWLRGLASLYKRT